jgi:16S rRNA (cytosine1402-N4)-methyltransferase
MDKDPEAVAHAHQNFAQDPRLTMVQGSFTQLQTVTQRMGVYGQISGILLDLGVSSPQLDDPERGFSFMQAGPLDMRMNTEQSLTAAEVVNRSKAEELASVFKEYGEERFAIRIARAIVEARKHAPIETTQALAEIVKQANPKWEKHKHPATRVFQALRIYVNQELDDLSVFLQQCVGALKVSGRLAVISFHSLEDRIVKQFMQREERGTTPPRGVPVRTDEIKTCFKRVSKAIKPGEDEVQGNVRARSAILRIGEKTA